MTITYPARLIVCPACNGRPLTRPGGARCLMCNGTGEVPQREPYRAPRLFIGQGKRT